MEDGSPSLDAQLPLNQHASSPPLCQTGVGANGYKSAIYTDPPPTYDRPNATMLAEDDTEESTENDDQA